jgi:hypothetical protein
LSVGALVVVHASPLHTISPQPFSRSAYDPDNDLHTRLCARGAELEAAVANVVIDPTRHFPAIRRDIRESIAQSEAGQDVESLVEELLS